MSVRSAQIRWPRHLSGVADCVIGPRRQAVKDWDGNLIGTHYRGSEALVAFGTKDDETMCVTLNRNDAGEWIPEDINSPSTTDWSALSETMPE